MCLESHLLFTMFADRKKTVVAPLLVLHTCTLLFVACGKPNGTASSNQTGKELKESNRTAAEDRTVSAGDRQVGRHERRGLTVRHAVKAGVDPLPDFRIETVPARVPDLLDCEPTFEGTEVSTLPLWKRERVLDIRLKRRELLQTRDNALATGGKRTPAEQRKLEQDWDRDHRDQLRELTINELRIQRLESPGPPSESAIIALKQKLTDPDPIFTEADMLTLEHLIPYESDLMGRSHREDITVRRLMDIYVHLAEQFPESVSRGEILRIAGNSQR